MASRAALPLIDTPLSNLAKPTPFSDASSAISNVCKDPSKRKRVKRSAKIKQCKLDARREQWLSQATGKLSELDQANHGEGQKTKAFQVEDNSETGVQHCDDGGSIGLDVAIHPHLSINSDSEADLKVDASTTTSDSCSPSPSSASSCSTYDFSEADSLPNSSTGNSPNPKMVRIGEVSDGNMERSQISNIEQDRSKVKNVLEDDENVFDVEADDWETAADALDFKPAESKISSSPGKQIKGSYMESSTAQIMLRPDTRKKSNPTVVVSRSSSGRAWRSDDAHRPASLPSLKKQQSLPVVFVHQQPWSQIERLSPHVSQAPLQCPICVEELDSTDMTFDPCSCGFQMCLFCHHRIALEHGRCPNCRKAYHRTAVPVKNSLTSPC